MHISGDYQDDAQLIEGAARYIRAYAANHRSMDIRFRSEDYIARA